MRREQPWAELEDVESSVGVRGANYKPSRRDLVEIEVTDRTAAAGASHLRCSRMIPTGVQRSAKVPEPHL